MEAIPVRTTMIPSTSTSHKLSLCFPTKTTSRSTFHPSRTRPLRFNIRSKQSQAEFQDFQSYARPSCLLPASEVKVHTNTSIESISSSLEKDKSKSLFRIKLGTSNMYGSSISNFNAGILICLIDKNGKSILQRIPVTLMMDHSTEPGDITKSDMLHFQRGSVDEFFFEGPKMSRLEALWVSVESGQWRLGSVSLTVISCDWQPSLPQDEAPQYTAFQYDFQVDNVLLGEGSDLSMLELRPSRVTELEGINPVIFFTKESSHDLPSPPSPNITNEESMREYADLKFSLLFYDALLTSFGASVSFLVAGDNTAFAFLVGGIGGFLYLLLLQRSVDGLPASELISSGNNKGGGTNALFKGIKGPIASVVLALGFAVFATRYSSGDLQFMILTPKDIMVAMMGFLACKVSVVLAAFKPITPGLKLPPDDM